MKPNEALIRANQQDREAIAQAHEISRLRALEAIHDVLWPPSNPSDCWPEPERFDKIVEIMRTLSRETWEKGGIK